MEISVDNLTHIYDGHSLFEKLSFHIQKGRKVCISGPSGSGKSTLLKILMGLVVPTQGDIVIGTEPLTEKSVWHLRRHIAYVSQEPDLGEGVVLDRIRRPFSYHANAHLKWDIQAVLELCHKFRLDKRLLDKDANDLSGGEKQRFALIVALLLKRPILCLDEPVSALDKETKRIVFHELESDASRTILFVSHEETLLQIADETIDLNRVKGVTV